MCLVILGKPRCVFLFYTYQFLNCIRYFTASASTFVLLLKLDKLLTRISTMQELPSWVRCPMASTKIARKVSLGGTHGLEVYTLA